MQEVWGMGWVARFCLLTGTQPKHRFENSSSGFSKVCIVQVAHIQDAKSNKESRDVNCEDLAGESQLQGSWINCCQWAVNSPEVWRCLS